VSSVVLVTGADGGIGGAVAARFAAGGWTVVAADRTPPDVTGLDGGPHVGLGADLAQVTECRALVADAVAATGRLDHLVNAAGLWVEGPVEDTTEEEWDRVVGVNLKGLHLAATEGAITNLSSDAGIQGNKGAVVYSASKGGVSNLTRAMALELAPRGVRVNAVCPGDVETPMLEFQAKTYGGGDPQAYRDDLLALYPQGPGRARFVRPQEVAELVWFLAQPAATPITGANLSVDFGLSAGI
jgi:NAD(P)-dependent dehydrogenase (short-subunit alcohol dehydrogenase family)